MFDQLRAAVRADRSQFWKDLSLPFYGYNRPGAKVSEGVRESFWLQGMMCGFPGAYFCIKAFSETDLTEDLKRIDVPTLDGSHLTVKVPPGASSGSRLRLRGKGIAGGDQLIEIKIVAPRAEDARSRELMEELARLHPQNPRADLGWSWSWVAVATGVAIFGIWIGLEALAPPEDAWADGILRAAGLRT